MALIRWGGGKVWLVVTSSCGSSLKNIVVALFLVQFSMTALLVSAGEWNGKCGLGWLKDFPFGPYSGDSI